MYILKCCRGPSSFLLYLPKMFAPWPEECEMVVVLILGNSMKGNYSAIMYTFPSEDYMVGKKMTLPHSFWDCGEFNCTTGDYIHENQRESKVN